MRNAIFAVISFCLLSFVTTSLYSQGFLDIELGPVFTGYSDVRIPGDVGTLFSLKDELKPKTAFYYRLKAGYTFKSVHTFSLLYAPLKINSEGSVSKDISFAGSDFPAKTPLIGI